MNVPKCSVDLIDAIQRQRENIQTLTSELIQIPTENPPGNNYREICNFLEKRLKKSGFEVQLIRAQGTLGDSEKHPRWNLVARHDAGKKGECIHFNSHTDVVKAGHGWSVNPFAGIVRDGRVYGRGACDMKGGLAASVVAAETFIKHNPNHRGAIEISATTDEESGGFSGVAFLAKKGYFNPKRVNHVIIPEPFNKDRICLGHRGVWWAEIETKGRIAHGSMPFLGDSAIRHMSAVLTEMEETLFPLLLNRKSNMPVVPVQAKTASLNINSIHGGEKEQLLEYTGLPAPCVADRCKITIDRRFLIEESLQDVKHEIKFLMEKVKAVRSNFEYEITDLFEVLPTMTDKNSKIVSVVGDSIKKICEKQPEYVISPGTYDQKHIDRIGQLKNCIAYGPGILELAHQPDEWVGIDDMIKSCQVMGLSIAEILN
jgi:succinyl-diaminopimelate desuccinylase